MVVIMGMTVTMIVMRMVVTVVVMVMMTLTVSMRHVPHPLLAGSRQIAAVVIGRRAPPSKYTLSSALPLPNTPEASPPIKGDPVALAYRRET